MVKDICGEPRSIPTNSQVSSPSLSFLPIDDENEDENASEVDRYLSSKFGVVPEEILDFWSTQESTFPYLSALASKIFAIPSATSSEEGNFSVLKNLIGDRRTCLSAASISDIFIVRSLS